MSHCALSQITVLSTSLQRIPAQHRIPEEVFDISAPESSCVQVICKDWDLQHTTCSQDSLS